MFNKQEPYIFPQWIYLSHGEQVFDTEGASNINPSLPNWPETLKILKQRTDSRICIWNANEAGGYYPWPGISDGNHDRLLYLIHENIHPENAPNLWYVSGDLNLPQNYYNWHQDFYPTSPLINVKPYPFTAINCFFQRYEKYLKVPVLFDDYYDGYPYLQNYRFANEIDSIVRRWNKKYKIICLVNQPKMNRLLTLRELAGREGFIYSFKATDIHELQLDGSIVDKENFYSRVKRWKETNNCIGWRWSGSGDFMHFQFNKSQNKPEQVESPDQHAWRDFSNENFDQTNQIEMTDVFHLPVLGTHPIPGFSNLDDYHDFFVTLEWMESHIELIHETYCRLGFLWSDKMCKAIWHLKPFLTIGCQGWYKHFTDNGFILYDEIFTPIAIFLFYYFRRYRNH